MKHRTSASAATILLLATVPLLQAAPQGTAFTYQGRLMDDNAPANGTYDLQFALFDADTNGAQVGVTLCMDNATVSEGLFKVELNFGAQFMTDARWLEVDVRADVTVGNCGTGTFVTLSPRQPLTAAPYALALPGLWTQNNATSPNIVGGFSGNTVAPGAVGATISGGGSAGNANQAATNFSVVAGGKANTASGNGSTVSGGSGNTASSDQCTVSGGANHTASGPHATVGGGLGNSAGGDDATVSGGRSNNASGFQSTISGGVGNTASNAQCIVAGGSGHMAIGTHATVGGGVSNTAGGDDATVSGGEGINGTGYRSTVAGGAGNVASNDDCTVSGGESNTASGRHATVGGGVFNSAIGQGAAVGGGEFNSAGGDYSFAAGQHARVRTPTDVGGGDTDGVQGTFVWSDASSGVDFGSTGPNQFLIRASGGVGIGTNNPGAFALAVSGTAANSTGSWSVFSDARLKQNITLVRAGTLDRLLSLRAVNFEYTPEAVQLRNLAPGPTVGFFAQDVEKVFPEWVAKDGDGYRYVTERGTTALIVEALRDLRAEKDGQLAEKDKQIADLMARLERMEKTVNSLANAKKEDSR